MPRLDSISQFFLTIPVTLVAACLAGCSGGLPLLHSAHVLPPGRVTVGAGLSGQLALQALPSSADTEQASREALVQNSTIAPAITPWVSARVGIAGSNEAGLSYSGRAIRLDGRHSFTLNKKKSLAISAGLGGELLLAGRPRQGSNDPQSLLGGGIDVPLLFGWRSTAGLYSAWIGPRPGITFVQGTLADGTTSLSAQDTRLGFVAGLAVGFRQIHVAMELGGAFHFIDAQIGTTRVEFDQFTLTPAGALVLSF